MFHCYGKLTDIVDDELAAANEQYPLFASSHEGYAVLLEELEEAEKELKGLQFLVHLLWDAVKRNSGTKSISEKCECIKAGATDLAAEAIQSAAMAQKMIDSMKGWQK